MIIYSACVDTILQRTEWLRWTMWGTRFHGPCGVVL